MLELRNISRRFGGLMALSSVSMLVPPGQVTGLIGPNGAGKTTMINSISGIDHPTGGCILFEGKAIERAAPHQVTRLGIARTYQNIRLFGELTARQSILVGLHAQGQASALEAVFFMPRYRREEKRLADTTTALLERFGLTKKANVPAGALPYGDQRRLEMARALATSPKLILLDEPTAGMNPAETYALGEQILRLKQEGVAVLVIEHDMSLIHQVCDTVYVLNFGQIIAHGTPAEIKANPEVIVAYLGQEDSD